jgi:branched-subunit amino acid aminotransferase/4-amino-4-deoxychorismate lyase
MVSTRKFWQQDSWCGAGEPGVGATSESKPVVVDSFLVEEGSVVDLREHFDRFRSGCAAMGIDKPAGEIDAFLAATRHEFAIGGRWFPRLEVYRDAGQPLALWMRPAPPPSESVWLWYPPGRDPRRHPTVKGPDIEILAGMRIEAVALGADDAILVSGAGEVVETAHSALLWWRDDVLCQPDPSIPSLPSITSARVVGIARELGYRVCAERCDIGALRGTEIWTANSLHGVRPVAGMTISRVRTPAGPVDGERFARFRSLLASASEVASPGGSERAHTAFRQH